MFKRTSKIYDTTVFTPNSREELGTPSETAAPPPPHLGTFGHYFWGNLNKHVGIEDPPPHPQRAFSPFFPEKKYLPVFKLIKDHLPPFVKHIYRTQVYLFSTQSLAWLLHLPELILMQPSESCQGPLGA